MLKPDPMRYSQAVPVRVNDPDWIEPEPAENEMAEASNVLAFRREGELPADLALDLRLHELLEHSLRETAATGALIALASGDKMVCRATSGQKTPSTGAFLNTQSGLSGLCVQTRKVQRCDDALTDARVNSDACRVLDIRSIVALPILEGTKLWGILEVFSSSPSAFNDDDVRALQALSRGVSRKVQEAVESGSLTPEVGARPARSKADSERSEATAREALAHEVLVSGLREPSSRGRDYRTGALTAAVIALAVLLGWMVGRVGWSVAVNRANAQLPTPEEVQAAVQVTPQTTPSAVVEKPAVSAEAASPASEPSAASRPVTKPRVEPAPAGGLVVYEQGKVVFRMAPSTKSSIRNSGSVQAAVTPEADAAGVPTTVSPDAATPGTGRRGAGKYVLERVDPDYPEEARQRRIEGPVVLKALVGSDGVVRELKVMSGDPLLAKAATDAVRQWRFEPHRVKGRPVEFETRITVNFALPSNFASR
jgi:TonB family protein